MSERDPDHRPSPEALLEAARREESQAGKLRIFVGAAPGVGKTYAMLETARARKRDGEDVVVGVVETHGRRETEALLDGLEVIPRAAHRVQGPLARGDGPRRRHRPPATDRAGRRARAHQCARQPASEALPRRRGAAEAAASTSTRTVNIQHIESLNDVVAQITRIRVRETVPDFDLRPRRRGRAHRPHAGGSDRAPQGREGLRPEAGRSARSSTSSRRPI